MSHIISNLYASRLFAEHPLAMWPLDDAVYFASLSEKDISQWTISGSAAWFSVSSSAHIPPVGAKLPDESKMVLVRTDYDTEVEITTTVSGSATLDLTKPTLCFNVFAYPYQALVDYFELGIMYTLADTSTFYDSVQVNGIAIPAWQKLQFTSLLPQNVVGFRPILKVRYTEGATLDNYDILLNAFSVGQWSEEFNYETTGDTLQTLTDPNLPALLPATVKVLPADTYGFAEEDTGYYIIDNNKYLATNTSMPMVYGSGNITHIEEPITLGMPGLAIPGKGFLNTSGRYKKSTLEFWLRTYSDSHDNIRIVGPISSDDGLYVNQEYLTLKIGKNSKSYFIGKWFRPKLIDIRYSSDVVSMLINGEEVLTMNIDQNYVDFPENNEDWIGFFGNEHVHPFDIDCVAIYPYLVPAEVAKRRFVYGQGVNGSEIIVNNFDGQSLYIDFPFANYASTLTYPETNTWNSGYFNNLDVSSKYISSTVYTTPELIHVDSIGSLDIYKDNALIQSGSATFFSLSPSASYSSINSYLHFDNIAKLSSPTKSVLGVFKSTPSLINTKKTLMMFRNSFDNNTFEIAINGSSIQYLYNNTIQHSASVAASSLFMVGFDIDKLSSNLQTALGNFFSNPQNISLDLGGNGSNTFTGEIYNLTFNNRFFTDKDCSTWFNTTGFIDKNMNDTRLVEYTGCYSLRPSRSGPVVELDVATAGYWEDSVPLTYFGKYVQDRSGNSYYDLDMLQFNIDYPSNPIISIPQHNENQALNHTVKSYITLQHYSQVGKVPYKTYTNTVGTTNFRVLDFDMTADVVATKFEVVDGTAIFPPKELVNFEDYYITIHIEIKSPGSINKPIQIPKMSMSSIVHNDTEFFGIGTKTGNKIYPIVKYGNAYSHKAKNPFKIYKDSTPYLYLTGDSGISCLANAEPNVTKGFSIPINQQKTSQYILGGIQMWLMYNESDYITGSKKIGRVITPDKELDIYIVSESSPGQAKRAFLKVFDSETGYEDITIDFYQNGISIQNPVIKPLMWSSVVMSFGESLALNGVSGQVELYGGFVYNNIALYKRSSLILGQSISDRTWQQVKTTEALINNEIEQIDLQWEDWYNSFWLDLIERRTTLTYIIDGERIFGAFLGISNSTISDESIVELESEGADVFSDVEWDLFFGRPV